MTKIQLRFAPSIVWLYWEGDAPMVGMRIPKAKKYYINLGRQAGKNLQNPCPRYFPICRR